MIEIVSVLSVLSVLSVPSVCAVRAPVCAPNNARTVVVGSPVYGRVDASSQIRQPVQSPHC